MTRLSRYFLPTEREAPADAEALSHKLMVRAGLIRQVGAGLWSWLPAGWRTHERIRRIVREEMDAIGGLEMQMPVLQPAEPWRRTGRYDIEEIFKLNDRRGAEMVLAMTHEEVVTGHVAQVVRSYRDLPLILYHFQVKERDEPRPRAGVLRTREFTMKDSYSFDRDEEGLAASYARHVTAYDRICERCGLEFYRVAADVGMMGGSGAHEYMAPCAAGEDEVALADGYAANLEIASADARPAELPAPLGEPETVSTPGLTTVDDVAHHIGVAPAALLKAYPIVVADRGLQLVLVRGDHRVNETKLRNALRADVRAAREEEIAERIGPTGFLGPVGANVPVLLDDAVADGGYVTGANRRDEHLRGVEPGRDFPFRRIDARRVEAGDTVGGATVRIETAIEVANIFRLGVRYSEPLGATYLDEQGGSHAIQMGCYGLGLARVAAAAVEQGADEQGISWPRALAPWDVQLVGLGREGSDERALADRLYEELQDAGLAVSYDDRDAGPGEKFADAELVGCPLRLTIGRRTLGAGEIEAQVRRGRKARSLPIDGAAEAAVELWRSLP